MLSIFNHSDPVQLVLLLIGFVLLLKRLADMDRYHNLRVVVLTTILSCIVIYFFFEYGFTLGNPMEYSDCITFH